MVSVQIYYFVLNQRKVIYEKWEEKTLNEIVSNRLELNQSSFLFETTTSTVLYGCLT